MSRSYRDGWAEIFGDRDDIRSSSDDEEFNYVEPPVVDASEIDWKNTRALSIRQPWAELIMLGEKTVENRGRATKVRGRIAIYASLSSEYLEDAEDYQLSLDTLPRGVIIGQWICSSAMKVNGSFVIPRTVHHFAPHSATVQATTFGQWLQIAPEQ